MEMLDLELSLEELNLPTTKYLVIPINASLDKYTDKLRKMHYPLWIKLNTSEHKLKLGGVKRANNYDELKSEYKLLQKKFPEKKFVIQENASGIELTMGINHDKTFGRVLMIGSGGSSVEEKRDIVFRALPLTKEAIALALSKLKIYNELVSSKANLTNLIDLIFKFSQMNIEEADVNPIIVNNKEALIVDARISISQS